MASLSSRGLGDRVLARLRSQPEQEGSSLNNLVLRLLQSADTPIQPGALKKFDDLNILASTWNDEEAQEFECNTAVSAEFERSTGFLPSPE